MIHSLALVYLFALIVNMIQGQSDICNCTDNLCSLIPPPDAGGFPCYQGDNQDATFTYKTDPLIKSGTTWICLSCEGNGYPYYLQNDPVYTNMELWSQTGADPTPAPTAAPGYNAGISFAVTQSIGGVSYEEFAADFQSSATSFFQCLARVLGFFDSSGQPLTGMFSMNEADYKSRKLESKSLQEVDSTYLYAILMPIVSEYYSFNSTDEAYREIVMNIDQSIQDGTLSVLMQYSGATAFTAANASQYINTYDYTEVEIAPPVSDDDDNKDAMSTGETIGIAFGCVCIVLVACFMFRYLQIRHETAHKLSNIQLKSQKNPLC